MIFSIYLINKDQNITYFKKYYIIHFEEFKHFDIFKNKNNKEMMTNKEL